MEIDVRILSKYTHQQDELRKEAFYQNHPNIEAKDEFDEISKYICVFDKSALVASGRYTEITPSVLQKWVNKSITLPSGNDYCNLTRAAIKKEYRGGYYYKLLVLENLMYCYINNKKKAMTIVEAERKRVVFFERLGWELYLEEMMVYKPPDGMTLGQFMLFNVEKNINIITEKRTHLIKMMLEQGVTVNSEIFEEFNNK
jgi:hypothetical protein